MRRVTLAFALAAAAVEIGDAVAAKPPRTGDQVWVHPEFASFKVQSIAMLPVATYIRDLDVERMVQGAWGQKFANTGYRWISANATRELVRSMPSGDSLLQARLASVLKDGRLDSLGASRLCARLRVDAVLSVLVDQWEQVAIAPDQSGKPSTSVKLRAALVDSTGGLLWSVSGSQTVEGDYHEPSQGDASRSGSGGTRSTGLGGASGAPPYPEVLERLMARWVNLFPAKPASAPDSTGSSGK